MKRGSVPHSMGMSTKLSNTAFALVFSSELAGHIHNPGRLGLDDLSLTWGKYEVTAGTGGPLGDGSPWVAVAGVRGWMGNGHLCDEAHRPCLLGKCQPGRGIELVWKCHLTLHVPW